jgi:putative modified peptide
VSESLPTEQGVVLIKRLATDDAFRARFEKDPATAMAEAGVDPDVCERLKRSCCEAKPLAPKEAYASLLEDIGGTAFMAAMEFQTPQIR